MYFIQDCLFLICRPSDSIVLAVRGNEPKTVPEVERIVMHARRSAQLNKFCTVSGFFRIEEDRNKILPLSMPVLYIAVSGKEEGGGAAYLFWPLKL